MEKGIVELSSNNMHSLSCIRGPVPLYMLKHAIVYHWLIRVHNHFTIRICMVKVTSIPELVSVYDGPGDQSPLLTATKHMPFGDRFSPVINVVHNTNLSTEYIYCSTHQSYILIEGNNSTIITQYSHIQYSQYRSKIEGVVHIASNEKIINIHSNMWNPKSHQLVYMITTSTFKALHISAAEYTVNGSNIWDCMYGGLAILEDNKGNVTTRMTLCNMDDGDFVKRTQPSITLNVPTVYVISSSYHPYSILDVILTLSTTDHIPVFLNLLPYPYLDTYHHRSIISSKFIKFGRLYFT